MSEKKEKKEVKEKEEKKEEKKEVKEEKKEEKKGEEVKAEKKGEEEKKSHVRHQGKPFLQIEDSKQQQWVINPSFVVYGRSGGGNSKNEVNLHLKEIKDKGFEKRALQVSAEELAKELNASLAAGSKNHFVAFVDNNEVHWLFNTRFVQLGSEKGIESQLFVSGVTRLTIGLELNQLAAALNGEPIPEPVNKKPAPAAKSKPVKKEGAAKSPKPAPKKGEEKKGDDKKKGEEKKGDDKKGGSKVDEKKKKDEKKDEKKEEKKDEKKEEKKDEKKDEKKEEKKDESSGDDESSSEEEGSSDEDSSSEEESSSDGKKK